MEDSSTENTALTDVFVCQLVGETDALRLMLDRLPVDNSMLELFDDCLVDGMALGQIRAHQQGQVAPLMKETTKHSKNGRV